MNPSYWEDLKNRDGKVADWQTDASGNGIFDDTLTHSESLPHWVAFCPEGIQEVTDINGQQVRDFSNADLLAAAPNLYIAARMAIDFIENLHGSSWDDFSPKADLVRDKLSEVPAYAALIRASLKAEGWEDEEDQRDWKEKRFPWGGNRS